MRMASSLDWMVNMQNLQKLPPSLVTDAVLDEELIGWLEQLRGALQQDGAPVGQLQGMLNGSGTPQKDGAAFSSLCHPLLICWRLWLVR